MDLTILTKKLLCAFGFRVWSKLIPTPFSDYKTQIPFQILTLFLHVQKAEPAGGEDSDSDEDGEELEESIYDYDYEALEDIWLKAGLA